MQEIITLAIEDEQVLSVSECNTAAEMWESLHAIHELCGQQSILSTKRTLYSTQAKEGLDIALHLGYMKILCECLAMCGHQVNHVEFKSILVASLPHSWESFTSLFLGYQGGTQGNQQAQVMTVQQLVSLLIKEAKWKNEKEEGAKYAFSAGSSSKPDKGKQQPCQICKRKNHITADCQFKGKPKCDFCNKCGHKDSESWKNPQNKGEGKVTKSLDKIRSKPKGKEHAHVTKDDTDSNEELDKAFTAHVSVVDNNSEADKAEFSAYSWIGDLGATSHICAEQDTFTDYHELAKKTIRGLGDKPITIYGTGTVFIVCHTDSRDVTTRLHDVLHIPEACENLLSLGRIDGIGGSSICTNGILKVHDQNGQLIAQGKRHNNLYYLDAHTKCAIEHTNIAIKLKRSYTWQEWHKHLGHIAITGLCTLHGKNLVNGFAIADSTQTFECDTCIKAKHTCRPLPKKAIQQECKSGETTHSDLWGPAPMTGFQGEKYYISFVDEATRRTKLMYLRHKNEAAAKMKQYLSWIERQGDKLPKIIHVDNGHKYMNRDLLTWCLDKGIEIHTTMPYMPKQNGIAERYNRTIVELGHISKF